MTNIIAMSYQMNIIFFSFVLRMKEHERERRLLVRSKRKGLTTASEELGD